jgi:hypothetical protein
MKNVIRALAFMKFMEGFELYQYVNMKLLGIRCKLQVLLFERNSQSSHHVSINLYQAIILQIA